MNLHLYMSAEALEDAVNIDPPSFARLLGMGRHSISNTSIEALLCQASSIGKQADWPVAAIASQAENWAEPLPETLDGYWLQLDPVHFLLQRDYFTLAQIVGLDAVESQALLVTLNEHFGSDGLMFRASADFKRWYLQLSDDPGISTTQPGLVIGQETTHYMPQGTGARLWNRLLNEMQMLLFEHPVNLAREERGDTPVNSMWLSGGGMLPAQPALDAPNKMPGKADALAIFADSVFAKGLRCLTSASIHSIPGAVHNVLGAKASNVWLVLENTKDWEEQWFLPLRQALRNNQVKQLTLWLEQQGQLLSVQINPIDTWKFWRKAQQLPIPAN